MLILYLIFLILFIVGLRIKKHGFNESYIDIKTTTIINGFFVVMIFFSHFRNYYTTSNVFDELLNSFCTNVGQMMVATFLFYSGYGIMESIKNKKDYIKFFFKNRFFPLWLNFSVAVSIYLLIGLFIGKYYDLSHILLSFIGFDSVGNSNWYIFTTFVLYIFTMAVFNGLFYKKGKELLCLICLTIFSIIYIVILGYFVKHWFIDTTLCFSFGMWFSYLKTKIEPIIFKNYFITLLLSLLLFVGLFFVFKKFGRIHNLYYNLLSISFVWCIVLISMKLVFRNKLYLFFGKNAFWIFILQRIPMILFQYIIVNKYIYFIVSFIVTILLSVIFNKLMCFVHNKNMIIKKDEN